MFFLRLNLLIIILFFPFYFNSFANDEQKKNLPRFQSSAQEPQFYIKTPSKTFYFSRSKFLKNPHFKLIHIPRDPAYEDGPMNYEAIPVSELFKEISISKESLIQFYCTDQFSAPILPDKILNKSSDHAKAYLAVENPNKKWPTILSSGKNSYTNPGPFYIVWLNPELSQIVKEEWPFQLKGFEIKPPLEKLFPDVLPSSDISIQKDHSIQKGLNHYLKNCFTCHTLNHAGYGKIGPDLNIPMNPTEYFTEKILKSFIRNPKSIRNWPESKMPGFDLEILSETELDELFKYLKHMSTRKVIQN